jgi:hypothetical protein
MYKYLSVLVNLQNRMWIALLILFVSALSYGRSDLPPDAEDTTATNLTVYQCLVDSVTVELAHTVVFNNTAIPVVVSLKGNGEKWFIQESVGSALRRLGYKTYFDSTAIQDKAIRLEVMPVLLLKYGSPSKGWIFGESKVERIVTVTFVYQIFDNQSREVLASGNLSRQANDVVPKGSIPSLENNAIPSTKAVAPEDNFLDRIIEPVVIIGAAGTAIYLFFHVRS